jgi:hypothetical protein
MLGSLMLAAPNACAGTYTDATTGGADPIVTPDYDNFYSNSLDAIASAYSIPDPDGIAPSSITIQVNPGAPSVTDTLTWTHGYGQTDANDPPPACVVVAHYITAYWRTESKDGTASASGSADCGLPSSVVTTPLPTYWGDDPSAGLPAGGSTATIYSVQSSPSASISFSCTPTGSFAGATGTDGDVMGEVGVQVQSNAYPITLSLGGTTPDSNQNPNILIGQQCTATVNGLPYITGATVTYVWSVSGTTFESWGVVSDPNNQSHTVKVDAIPATNSTSWYWNDPANASETVSCTVTVTPPAGQGNPFTFTVSAPKPVSVQVPDWHAMGTGGYMEVDTNAPGQNGASALYAGSGTQYTGGMDWSATSTTPSLFGKGTLEMVQTVIPNMSLNTFPLPGRQYNDPENGLNGLDTVYPYPATYYNEGLLSYGTDDSPSLGLNSYIGSATMHHSFTDYLMYEPPGSNQWVPLESILKGQLV